MKKCILTAVIVLAMSGFAAAQTTKAQEVPKTQKTAAQKSTTPKTTTKNPGTSNTQATASQVELPGKIKITLPAADTSGVPVKNKQ